MQPNTVSIILDQNGRPTNFCKNAYITTQTTTLVKSGNTFLHCITFNNPVATGTVEIDNAITQTNPIAIITTPANPQLTTIFYDCYLPTGLSITTGVATQNITVSYL
jgi:hypothetical protein